MLLKQLPCGRLQHTPAPHTETVRVRAEAFSISCYGTRSSSVRES